jgi:hypothetical protein
VTALSIERLLGLLAFEENSLEDMVNVVRRKMNLGKDAPVSLAWEHGTRTMKLEDGTPHTVPLTE